MSHASYHQQKNFVLPNISLVFRNVTFPSAVAWNKLKDDGSCWYGKRMRFYDSSGRATNLLLLNDSNVYYNYNYTWGRFDYSYIPYYDYTTEWWFLTSIFLSIFWPIFPLLVILFSKICEKSSQQSLFLFPMFWIYGMFGMVEKQLNLAARYGYLSGVQACLKRGVDVNCTDNKSYVQGLLQFIFLFLVFGPCYFLFVYFYSCCFFKMKFEEKENEFLFLFSNSGNADTPLILAVWNRHLPVVTYLLQQNANVKMQNVRIVIVSLYLSRLFLYMSDLFRCRLQDEGKIAADFAVRNLRNTGYLRYLSEIDDNISIYLALINRDPDWDPNQLLVEVVSGRMITRPLIDVFSPTNRLKLLAGINLTLQCVTAHNNALFFVIIQSDGDKSDIDEEGQEEEDEEINSSFYILKRNLEELIKRYPRLLTVQVLLYTQYMHFQAPLLCTLLIPHIWSPIHYCFAGQRWTNGD